MIHVWASTTVELRCEGSSGVHIFECQEEGEWPTESAIRTPESRDATRPKKSLRPVSRRQNEWLAHVREGREKRSFLFCFV